MHTFFQYLMFFIEIICIPMYQVVLHYFYLLTDWKHYAASVYIDKFRILLPLAIWNYFETHFWKTFEF